MMYVLHVACGMPVNELLCEQDEKEGSFLLKEVFDAGNFGHQRQDKSLRQNSLKRLFVMTKHYPSEVSWMIPWKLWHKCWRVFYFLKYDSRRTLEYRWFTVHD